MPPVEMPRKPDLLNYLSLLDFLINSAKTFFLAEFHGIHSEISLCVDIYFCSALFHRSINILLCLSGFVDNLYDCRFL